MSKRNMWWVWAVDILVVVSFAVIGRDSHGFAPDLAEVARICAPFLLALLIAIGVYFGLVARVPALTSPLAVSTGVLLGVVTWLVGMGFRRYAFDDGTATTFVLVTGLWIVGWMVGWRLAFVGLRRLASR